MRTAIALVWALAVALSATRPSVADDNEGPAGEVIHYQSDGLSLAGYVYKPEGNGPFPVYIWNHGSDREPHHGANLAKFFVPRGFVLFAPIRSGHGDNPGTYIMDAQRRVGEQRSAEGFREVVALHERASDDTVAAYQWIARQPYADPKRIVVSGGSFGGIQVLLTAERDAREHLGVRCFVAMSPAAQSWRNPNWDPRLSAAVAAARAPIFLLQAENDYDLGVTDVLGPRIDAKGFPNRHKLFPPHGDPNDHRAGHAGFFSDPSAWGDDVIKYLRDCGAAPRG